MEGQFYQANNPTLIHCLCNKRHIIFPQGISFKTLYKNHNGIRIHVAQNLLWEKNDNYTVVQDNVWQASVVDKATHKQVPLRSAYVLTEEQLKLLKVKCPTCFPFVPAKK